MPFHTMEFITFDQRIKKYIYSDKVITLSQLKSAFKNDPAWISQLNEIDSTLFYALNGWFLTDDEDHQQETAYDFQMFWLYGLLHCHSTPDEKIKGFYNIL